MENQHVQRSYRELTKILLASSPQEVLDQLRECFPSLPTPIVRIIHILIETGMRIREVCGLNNNKRMFTAL